MVSQLDRMVASQLMQVLAPPVKAAVINTVISSERQALVEGFSEIPTGTGRALVKEFGEELLLNPHLIPLPRLRDVMPRATMSRVKELSIFYGVPEGVGHEKVGEKKSKVAVDEDGEEKMKEPVPETGKVTEPVDLLDFGDAPEIPTDKKMESADLLDFDDAAPSSGELLDVAAPITNVPTSDGDLLDMAAAPTSEDIDDLLLDEPNVSPTPAKADAVTDNLLFDFDAEPSPAPNMAATDLFSADLFAAQPVQVPAAAENLFNADPFAVQQVQQQQQAPLDLFGAESNLFGGQQVAAPVMPMPVQGYPSAPLGNPWAAPMVSMPAPAVATPQAITSSAGDCNPFGAADDNSNPFEQSNDDAFAFAVCNLKDEMRKNGP